MGTDTPQCPRCGYDQRGPVSTWTDSCPLQGTCSECGLSFNWAEVLLPDKFEPRWCVEFVPRMRSVPKASFKTFWRSFWPWGFWSRLKMSQRVRKRRLLAHALLSFLPLLLIVIATQASLAIYMRWSVQQGANSQSQYQLQWQQSHLQFYKAAKLVAQMSDNERDAFFADPANRHLGLDEFTFQDINRSGMDTLEANITQLELSIAGLKIRNASPPVITISYPVAIFEAIFTPMKQFSWGAIQYADGMVQPYPAPRELFEIFALQFYSWSPIGIYESNSIRWLAGVASGILLTLLLPATFILLPMSRRRAKVRWVHVGRIFTYSLFAISTLMMVIMLTLISALLFNQDLIEQVGKHAPFMFWIGFPIWWGVAIKRYLKMEHAAAIAVLMTIMLGLLMSPLLMYVFPGWIMRWVLT